MKQEKRTVRLMGTVIDLLIEDDGAEERMDEVVKQLKIYEHRFSANSPNSELMAINKQAGIKAVRVHPELFELIRIGKAHSCASGSHLNIAIGPLVQTWRIGFSDARVPSDDEIKQLLRLTDPQDIILDEENQTVFLKQKGMLIDLGSLAKGYIADLIIKYLKSKGVKRALVNLGGNIIGLNTAHFKEDYWKIGIQNPVLPRDHYVTVLKISNQSVVTSGIYERHLEKDGKSYHHILDPETGYPITTDVASLTIQSNNSVDGEIWTTRLYGKQSDDIVSRIDQEAGIEGLVITKDGYITYSHGLKKDK